MIIHQKQKIKKFLDNSLTQIYQAKKVFSLKKSQWLDHSILEKNQEKKLEIMIRHAYKNVEYYHKLFRSLNLTPNDIKKVSDLRKIPILTKAQIQKNSSKVLSRTVEKNKLHTSDTSGSSGRPLKLFF